MSSHFEEWALSKDSGSEAKIVDSASCIFVSNQFNVKMFLFLLRSKFVAAIWQHIKLVRHTTPAFGFEQQNANSYVERGKFMVIVSSHFFPFVKTKTLDIH